MPLSQANFRGVFLTTFAEKSPEAAIPLDNSDRAKSLWTKVGQILGILPGKSAPTDSPPKISDLANEKILNPTPTFPTQVQNKFPKPQEKKSSTIFNRKIPSTAPKLPDRILNPIPTFPSQVQNKFPKQNSTPLPTEIFNKKISFPSENENSIPKSLDNLFGGGVKFPQEINDLMKVFGGFGEEKNSVAQNQTLPPINISVTVNGNANEENLRQAGNEIGFELERKLDAWWQNKVREENRRSFA